RRSPRYVSHDTIESALYDAGHLRQDIDTGHGDLAGGLDVHAHADRRRNLFGSREVARHVTADLAVRERHDAPVGHALDERHTDHAEDARAERTADVELAGAGGQVRAGAEHEPARVAVGVRLGEDAAQRPVAAELERQALVGL